MNLIFGLLAIVAAILLIFIVMVQNSKGGGLSNAFGASNLTNVIGTRRATQDIEKFTWYLVAALMILAFFANVSAGGQVVAKQDSFESMMSAPSAPAQAPPADGGAAPEE
jgi:preprotein translocase subunit SecG